MIYLLIVVLSKLYVEKEREERKTDRMEKNQKKMGICNSSQNIFPRILFRYVTKDTYLYVRCRLCFFFAHFSGVGCG